MAQISKGDTFTNGEQVTGARLNQLVDSATILSGAITEQGAMTANTVAENDSVLLHDLSANALRKPTVGDLLNSNLPITTSSITGGAGVDVTITPAAGQKVDIAGNLEAENVNVVGTLNGTSAIKIATGTEAERPATPLAGHIRFNTTSGTLEVYSGTGWINGNTSGSALFDGTVNITGAIQFNSRPVYAVYEFVENSDYAYVASGTLGGFTGSKYQSTTLQTKTAEERWQVNFNVSASFGDYYSPLLLTSYTTKIIDNNGVVYATQTTPFVQNYIPNEGGQESYDDMTRQVSISVLLPAATVFSGVTLAVVVAANTSPTVSRVNTSPFTGQYNNAGVTFTNSVSGIKYTTA